MWTQLIIRNPSTLARQTIKRQASNSSTVRITRGKSNFFIADREKQKWPWKFYL